MEGEGLGEIRTDTGIGYIIISVKDTAGGIPEEIRDCLLGPFTFKRNMVQDWSSL